MKEFNVAKNIAILTLFFITASLKAQVIQPSFFDKPFYFDAVCFKADDNSDSSKGRVDVYALIPYQTLAFEKHKDVFGAKYRFIVEVYNSDGQSVRKKIFNKSLAAGGYFKAQGGKGDFVRLTHSFYLPKGDYQIDAILIDDFANKNYSKSRAISVINFNLYSLSLSGIMLLSAIEESGGEYIITPHLSENVGLIDGNFFIFYEVYDNVGLDSIALVYEIVDESGNRINKSDKFWVEADKSRTRHFKNVQMSPNLEQGKFKIRLIALQPGGSLADKDTYYAIAERSIKYFKTISGYLMKDIKKAIEYLRYAANQKDIEYIKSGANKAEKRKRFQEFWESMDPSPNTERNEAFEEYYRRINYANKHFQSYTQGWLADMGRVYIIFGKPDYTERYNSYSGRAQYIRWKYNKRNREFLFVDYTGMGDYRLADSFPITEKYRYED